MFRVFQSSIRHDFYLFSLTHQPIFLRFHFCLTATFHQASCRCYYNIVTRNKIKLKRVSIIFSSAIRWVEKVFHIICLIYSSLAQTQNARHHRNNFGVLHPNWNSFVFYLLQKYDETLQLSMRLLCCVTFYVAWNIKKSQSQMKQARSSEGINERERLRIRKKIFFRDDDKVSGAKKIILLSWNWLRIVQHE